MTLELNAKRSDVLLLVGTRMGAFLMAANASRIDWNVPGPHSPGYDTFHMSYDTRGCVRASAAVTTSA